MGTISSCYYFGETSSLYLDPDCLSREQDVVIGC